MSKLDAYSGHAEELGASLSTEPLLMKVVRRMGVPQEELFAYVSDSSRLSEWIPGAKKSWSDDSEAEAPGQRGSVRVISSGIGKPTRELIKAYQAPRALAYSASDSSLMGLMTRHLSVIGCEPHPDGGSVFAWLAYGRVPANRVKAFIGKKVFQAVLHNGTKALERKFPLR